MRAHETAKERHHREREALRRLARVLAEEARGGVLDEALGTLIEGLGLPSGGAFTVEAARVTLVAERGVAAAAAGGASPSRELRAALTAIADRVSASRKPWRVADVAHVELDDGVRNALGERGFSGFAAQPIKHQREVVGILVLLEGTGATLDVGALAFIETVGHMLGLALDRDRHRERETSYRQELVAVSRMATLGALTASTSPDLQARIVRIVTHLGEQARIIGDLREGATDWARPMLAELSELLADITDASVQTRALVEQLRGLTRRDALPERLDLSIVLREGLGVVRGELKRRGVLLVEDFEPKCMVNAHRDIVVRVLLGLVLNAVEACTSLVHPSPQIVVRTRAVGALVLLQVDDTGASFPEGELGAVFQPLYAHRARPQHSGLGLHVYRELASADHAALEAVNLAGGGASLRVSFARVASTEGAQSPSPSALPTEAPPPEDREVRRIFMVDDDEVFTRSLKRSLVPNEVRSATTASEAEMALLDPTYAPHVVLCDVGLPGMTGDTLHARVALKRPLIAQRFVFVTGGACSAGEAEYLRSSGCATLQKPFTSDEIWSALASTRRSQRAPVGTDRRDARTDARTDVPGGSGWPGDTANAATGDGYSDLPTLPPEMLDPPA